MPFVEGVRWSFRGKDAGSADSPAIGATEDAASGRPARPYGTTCVPPNPPALEQDLCGRLEAATAARELDGAVQVGVGVRELLRERQGVPRLDQDMEAPGLDLLALR